VTDGDDSYDTGNPRIGGYDVQSGFLTTIPMDVQNETNGCVGTH
jgi:hypothetical protein